MTKDPAVFLTDILESINQIKKHLKKISSKNEFLKNTTIQDAIFRRLEIIGEATRNLPAEFRRKYPHIPWQKISGTRDKLIHQYFDVDLEIVWETVNEDLPKLKEQISKLLNELPNS